MASNLRRSNRLKHNEVPLVSIQKRRPPGKKKKSISNKDFNLVQIEDRSLRVHRSIKQCFIKMDRIDVTEFSSNTLSEATSASNNRENENPLKQINVSDFWSHISFIYLQWFLPFDFRPQPLKGIMD